MIIWEQFKPKRPASSGKGLGQDMPGSEFDHVANPKDEKTKVPKKERTKKKISQDKKIMSNVLPHWNWEPRAVFSYEGDE